MEPNYAVIFSRKDPCMGENKDDAEERMSSGKVE
jgi:hypothetical protein